MPLSLKSHPTSELRKLKTEYRIYINGLAKSPSPKIEADLVLAYQALEAVTDELRKRGELVPRARNPKKKKPAARAANPSQRDAIYDIRNQRPFKASALSGSIYGSDSGRLGPSAAAAFREAVREAEAKGPRADTFYAVYSYGTPIAWWVRGQGWTIIGKSAGGVSATTAKHLSLVRQAVGEVRVVNPRVRGEAARELKAASRIHPLKPSDKRLKANRARGHFVLLDAGPYVGGSEAFDRYTLICTKPRSSATRAYYYYPSLVFGPGVLVQSEISAAHFRALKEEGFRSLGQEIRIDSLPPTYRRAVDSFMVDCG